MTKRIKRLLGVLVLLAVFYLVILFFGTDGIRKTSNNPDTKSELKVHFINVGQGNAVLLELDGHFMIIDGGDKEYSSKVASYLDILSVRALDYLVATHYDTDHLYGLVNLMYRYDVNEVLAPDYETNTKIYDSFESALKVKNKISREPKVGEEIEFGDAVILCVAPGDSQFQNENDYSIGFKVIYGDTSFLMCGDATYRSEIDMLESGIDLESDVYLVSHHGSSSSSTSKFLEAVNPRISVISCGKNNEYGHPTKKVLKRLEKTGTDIYRTDELDDIVISSDGKIITVNCKNMENVLLDNKQEEYDYVVNTNSKKIHLKSCDSVKDMSEKNKMYYAGLKEQLIKMGYTPCKKCNP